MIDPVRDPIGSAIVERLADLGFDYIELSLADLAALPEGEFARIVSRVGRSGIGCEACNNFFPPRIRLTGPEARLGEALAYAGKAIERAARLGASIIVFGSSGAKNVPAGFSKEEAWKQIVELLRQTCREQNVTLILVTHTADVAGQFDRVEQLEQINLAWTNR